jgi:rubredoxin
MIDLTIEDFILWVISVPMVMIGFYTVVGALRRRATLRVARRNIVHCRVCGFIYQDSSREQDPVCPECGRANERGRSRRLG